MIRPDQAKTVILKKIRPCPVRKKEFMAAWGHALAQSIKAVTDLPPFDRATVDGFALRSLDTRKAKAEGGIPLNIVDTVAAGQPSRKTVNKDEAVEIMTGGVVPRGADAVLMKEFTRKQRGSVYVLRKAAKGEGVAFRGEDIRKGRVILRRGHRINAGTVSLLAGMGMKHVLVYRKPRVGILVTGNELLSVGSRREFGKILSANEYGLAVQVKRCGGDFVILGIAEDRLRDLRRKIREGLRNDMLLISGGVSVGEYDLVPRVLREFGTKIYFHKVAVQPGKPLLFGRAGKTFIFGLPGNPVSSLVAGETFVAPAIKKMAGHAERDRFPLTAQLDKTIRFPPERTKILRGVLFERRGRRLVRLTDHIGSGNVISMARANCLFQVPEGVSVCRKGTRVEVAYLE